MTTDVAPTAAPAVSATATRHAGRARLLGTLLAALGALMVVAGIGAWGGVAQGLNAERAVVSDDAPAFAGAVVDTPWEAWSQAEAIKGHLDGMTGGLTYAEMERDDPQRDTVATGTFLRASLMTSVIAFGVALAVVGVGTGFLLGGIGLRNAAAAR
ncbi:aromatic ring-opening dioxygenase LigA [Cellulomonas phragmiteti]|uniref:Aromatic ring-opening dioxygenase LigA n=1 Tax=Cellulomonas phragmiteti TaxID=478780 RepID=A0ABQ4DJG0_9CELL|nr:aromatic ring-opening dioxygenase LigA [Cellulomonas phragmiteti]GIG39127.1 hypothetical protein Cph01nite_08890 [Cellulomonas phragmiteti]